MKKACVLAVAVLAMFAAACGNSSTSPTTVSSIAVTGTVPAMGATSQFSATATLSNGSTQDVTTQATWTSSDGTIATVASNGVVTAVAAGSVTISAMYQNVTGLDPISLVP